MKPCAGERLYAATSGPATSGPATCRPLSLVGVIQHLDIGEEANGHLNICSEVWILSRLGKLFLLPLVLMLGACSPVVLAPAGDIAIQQRDILYQSVILMLIIIVPVMALTVLFAWRYRAANREARYDPEWSHSMHLELVIWAAPLLIIICLGAITWAGTHLLDPYRPLDRVGYQKPVTEEHEPLNVEVVALDWKWLFIYPDYGVASVNEMAAPVDRPIHFRLTASSVMNSFYIPALAGMIYAMPGMQTQLHAVINREGTFEGFSSNFSGAGFSGMRFAFHGTDDAGFDEWIAAAKQETTALDRTVYMELEKPSEKEPVRHFGSVDADLFRAIVNMCVDRNRMCMDDMMAIDESGGLGLAGATSMMPHADDVRLARRAVFGPRPSYVVTICTTENPTGLIASASPAVGGLPLDAGLSRLPIRPLATPAAGQADRLSDS